MSLFNFGKKEKKEEASSTEIKLTGDIARKILSMSEFQTYREYYAKAEAATIDELILEATQFCDTGADVNKFGGKCLVKLTRLRDMRSLLTKVLSDSKKGTDDEGREEKA